MKSLPFLLCLVLTSTGCSAQFWKTLLPSRLTKALEAINAVLGGDSKEDEEDSAPLWKKLLPTRLINALKVINDVLGGDSKEARSGDRQEEPFANDAQGYQEDFPTIDPGVRQDEYWGTPDRE
ncbi:hypothetical protein ISCGN_029406 [Ixodes scapularis]